MRIYRGPSVTVPSKPKSSVVKRAGFLLAALPFIVVAALSLYNTADAACRNLDARRCESGASNKPAKATQTPKLAHTPTATATVKPANTPAATGTLVPTATSTSTPTSTKVPSTSTPVPPSVTPTTGPTVLIKSLPARSNDGTFYITDPGVYSGKASCGNIGSTAHCVHIWESGGVTLQDFTITTAQGTGLQLDNNTTIKRGTITAPNGAATAWHKVNVTVDGVTFDSPIGGLGFLGGGCETMSPRPNRQITIRNSSFINQFGEEMLYMKCAQDVVIEDNYFAPSSAWALSTPDGLNIIVRRNTFDLRSESTNWLAIELPKVINVDVVNNTVLGPEGDWFIYVNSGTNDLVITDNCIASGIGVVHTAHQ